MATEFFRNPLFSDANLIAYYRLEDVNDSKGSNTLTNNNSVTFSAAKFNNGAVFNGSNFLNTSSAVAVGTGSFTMSTWVSVASLPGSFYVLLGAPANYPGLLMTPTGFSVGKSGVTPGSNVAYTVSLNTLYLVTAVVTSTTTADIYVNGIYIGTSTDANVYTLANHTFNFGCGYNVGDVPLTGILDDISIFSRALTAAEILSLYLYSLQPQILIF